MEETSPRAGQALADAPGEIVLRFTEPVDAVPGGVRVYDARAHRVDRGGPLFEDDGSEAVRLDLPPLKEGAYIVTWRVASADSQVTAAVERFSKAAFWAVLVLIATGTLQALRQVGEPAALTGTTYGRVLLVKLGAFAGMVLLAAGSRRLVRALSMRTATESSEHDRQAGPTVVRLRRSIILEVVFAVAVLGMTALLVNAIPARDALALPYSTDARAGPEVIVDVSVEPAKAGPLDLHLYTLTSAGAPVPVTAVDASLTLRDGDIGPLVVPLVRAGPNHFASYGFDLPVAGQWVLSLVVEERAGRRSGAEVSIPIR